MADVGAGLIDGSNLVGGLLQHSKTAQDFIDAQYDHAAKVKAGGLIAAGDNAGASAILGSRGLLPDAEALKGVANDQVTLGALNSGDYAGARTSAANSGDPAMYGTVVGQQQKEIAQRAQFLGNAADALIGIKGADDATTQALRHQAFTEHVAPVLKQMGVPDDQIASVGTGHMDDQSLNSFKASVGQMTKMNIQTDADGNVIGIDPVTGSAKILYKGAAKPYVVGDALVGADGKPLYKDAKKQYKLVKNADGSENLVEVDPDAPASSAPVGPSSGGPSATGPSSSLIATAAGAAGANPHEINYLQKVAQVESSSNPNTPPNGSSTGLFQFHPDTFASVGGTNINDPVDQTKAALTLRRRDQATLQAAGIEPSDANLYIMHQQGAAGGAALLKAPPEVNAVAALTPVYGSAALAKKAIVGNGGTTDMTAGQFIDHWQQKWNGPAASPSPSAAPQTGSARVIATGNGLGAGAGGLTPEAIEQGARRYAITGVLPSSGMGKSGAADKEAIQNRAAELSANDPDIVSKAASYKADMASLTKESNTRQAMEVAEQNALGTLGLALDQAKKSAAPNVWGVSGALQAGKVDILHDGGATQLRNYLKSFATEASKVTAGNTGNNGGTDAAYKESLSKINEGMPYDQLVSAAEAIKNEMAVRVASQQKAEDKIRSRLTSYLPPPAGSASTAPQTPTPSTNTAAAPKAPAVGAVQGGYKFKGGDPSNQANWTKVQ